MKERLPNQLTKASFRLVFPATVFDVRRHGVTRLHSRISIGLRAAVALLLGALVPQQGLSSELLPEQVQEIRASVELFRAFEQCRVSGPFADYGFGAGGPCADWMVDFRQLQREQDGLVILQAGFECLAADIHSYGTTFYSQDPDLEWRQFVKDLFDACEAAIQ